jgi:hypothetical protein
VKNYEASATQGLSAIEVPPAIQNTPMSEALDGQKDHKYASITPINVATSINLSAWQHQNGQVVVKEDPISKSAQMMTASSGLMQSSYVPSTSSGIRTLNRSTLGMGHNFSMPVMPDMLNGKVITAKQVPKCSYHICFTTSCSYMSLYLRP